MGGGNGGGAGRTESFSTINQFYSEQTEPPLCVHYIDAKILNYSIQYRYFIRRRDPHDPGGWLLRSSQILLSLQG